MSYTIDSVLDDPLITVLDRDDEKGSFAIRLGVLGTPISVDPIQTWLTSQLAHRIRALGATICGR